MQAGYQYDRKAAAKALKASLKNRRRDKVLYGAVIKQESVFSSTTTGHPPAPPSTLEATVGTTTSTQPPAPPGAPSVPSAPSASQPVLSPEATTSLRRPPNPLFAELLSAGPLRTGQASPPLPARSTPAPGPQHLAITLDVLNAARERLKRTDKTIKPPVVQKTLQEIKASQTPTPVDAREHNVVVGTPVETVAPPIQATIVPTAITTPTAIGEPILSSLAATSAVSEKVKSGAEASAGETPIVAKIDLLDSSNPLGASAQATAKALFEILQAKIDKKGHTRNLIHQTITAYDTRDQPTASNMKITLVDGIFKFSSTKETSMAGSMKKTLRWYPDYPDRAVDVITSLKRAIKDISNSRVGVNGTISGLGVSEDPDKIGSTRVVYRSSKNPNSVAKGQLYLMQPQLIRGHIRLYNKSGRPVVSRSNVSPAFQSIARDIVERNAFEADDYKNLDPKETADANMFIQSTLPIQPRNINRLANADTIWKMKKRYEVLVGQMAAGNDGKIVRDEMADILKNLIRMHAMAESKGRDLIKALREY